jgi:predicted DNA-binding transcriptional regulator AlpA
VDILRLRDVTSLTGLSRTTLWRLERGGQFPKRIRLSPNSIGWEKRDIVAWLTARPRGIARNSRRSTVSCTHWAQQPEER